MRRQTHLRRGMAIVVVMMFSLALLILGSFYIRRFSQSTPINTRLVERVQADFLGYGVLQMALLKFKQLPSEFYFAYNAIVLAGRVITPDPWATYRGGRLQGAMTTPFAATYMTDFRVLGQNKFNSDAIQISVTVDCGGVRRVVNHTVNAVRVRN
ncbi:MAG: hypothetical protein BWY66_01526 [bacterium ADurb.Bin374]|nr:MAG: hypothetical protein BWY66_01526 [bacterium ADurb.Bin374]